jgi:hypothetical protein
LTEYINKEKVDRIVTHKGRGNIPMSQKLELQAGRAAKVQVTPV